MTNPDNQTILVVEDNDHDVFFLQRAFKKAHLNTRLQIAHDGREAIDYLSGAGPFGDRAKFPLPALILMDVKLPQIDGLEVLKWVRSQPQLRTLIVIMLTSSHLDVDVHRAYCLGANSFLVKTSAGEKLVELARLVHDYWLNLNHGPPVDVPCINQ